jgi:hypothetical protein
MKNRGFEPAFQHIANLHSFHCLSQFLFPQLRTQHCQIRIISLIAIKILLIFAIKLFRIQCTNNFLGLKCTNIEHKNEFPCICGNTITTCFSAKNLNILLDCNWIKLDIFNWYFFHQEWFNYDASKNIVWTKFTLHIIYLLHLFL